MAVLYTSSGSPFGRKPRLAIHHLNLGDRVSVTPAAAVDPEDPIHKLNPLHKIPVLTTDEGEALFDSRVIMEYLNWMSGGKIIPAEPSARFRALAAQALGDGLTDATVLIRYEDRYRTPEQKAQVWLSHQQKKIDDTLASLEAKPPARTGVDIGQIAIACSVSFYGRHVSESWRPHYPKMAAWLDDFEARVPAYGATKA